VVSASQEGAATLSRNFPQQNRGAKSHFFGMSAWTPRRMSSTRDLRLAISRHLRQLGMIFTAQTHSLDRRFDALGVTEAI
jgi:hypothetical protein